MRRGIDRRRDGSYRVRLPADERDVLAALPAQLREALQAGEPTLYRLFPPAFVEDDIANAEYARLVGGRCGTASCARSRNWSEPPTPSR